MHVTRRKRCASAEANGLPAAHSAVEIGGQRADHQALLERIGELERDNASMRVDYAEALQRDLRHLQGNVWQLCVVLD